MIIQENPVFVTGDSPMPEGASVLEDQLARRRGAAFSPFSGVVIMS
jgi:hypothetical protein